MSKTAANAKAANKDGLVRSSTSFADICTTRSRIVGMPSGRFFPSAFGMYRRNTIDGRYVPSRSATPIPSRKVPTPLCSIATSVTLSTPAAPLLLRTRFHASPRTSLRERWLYSAWKRRSGDRLAAPHSRRCSRRTWSTVLRPPGWLGPLEAAIPSRLPAPPTRSPQGPLPPVAFFCATIDSTAIPSDSRSTALDFAFGLYEPPRRDDGSGDGSPVFRASPSTRAALNTRRDSMRVFVRNLARRAWPSP